MWTQYSSSTASGTAELMVAVLAVADGRQERLLAAARLMQLRYGARLTFAEVCSADEAHRALRDDRVHAIVVDPYRMGTGARLEAFPVRSLGRVMVYTDFGGRPVGSDVLRWVRAGVGMMMVHAVRVLHACRFAWCDADGGLRLAKVAGFRPASRFVVAFKGLVGAEPSAFHEGDLLPVVVGALERRLIS